MRATIPAENSAAAAPLIAPLPPPDLMRRAEREPAAGRRRSISLTPNGSTARRVACPPFEVPIALARLGDDGIGSGLVHRTKGLVQPFQRVFGVICSPIVLNEPCESVGRVTSLPRTLKIEWRKSRIAA